MRSEIPRYIVWSADDVDTDDPFQRRWLLRQILIHGRAEDIHQLNLSEVSQELEALDLPPDLHQLWKSFLESRHGDG